MTSILNIEGWGDGAAIDIMWGSSADYTPVNKVKIGANLTRRITGTVHRNNQVIGSTICKYGRSTRYTCGELISKTFNTTRMQVRRLGTNLSDPGDSGGPWFVSNDAYGTHVGSTDVLDDNGDATGDRDAIYMAINFFSHLAIEVLTE